MEVFGICNQSFAPVRKQPGDTSEMVNQLIYGDLLYIKAKVNSWLLIETVHDAYEGWVDIKQVKQLTKDQFRQLADSPKALVSSVAAVAALVDYMTGTMHLSLGSTLYQFRNNTFNNMEGEATFSGELLTLNSNPDGQKIALDANRYLNAPYLWGGRSVWGIDCSGLVQMSYLLNGIALPRDAADQSQKGEIVHFIHEIKAGDLAFFDNEEGKIVHVGLIMPNKSIIHASGKVRIDSIDHQGIYQPQTQQYSHKLRLIKRIIPS
ncbi:MAG: C40 family peptidase [Bacteroidales bacterium]|jgi:cell wall-associated NlpC family hydrolase|nr:C40 family peptidase [Bacteroidales bacterium]